MTSSSSCPFSASGMITDPRYFVGRREELNSLTNRMIAAQPTSVNVVGKKRMGKSSLLYHFYQTYEQRVSEPGKYVVVYLSLQDGNCKEENSFYQVVAEKFLQQSKVRNRRNLRNPWKNFSGDRLGFSQAIWAWEKAKVLPILCLDKFEEWLDKPQEFNNDFYDNLRSLLDSNVLMLIIASESSLKRYAQEKNLTSDFFNLGHVLTLNGLTEMEAEDLVELPRGNNPGLSIDKQKLALAWGERHPYKLQLAGCYLWEAENQKPPKDEEWAKEKFLANCPVNKKNKDSKFSFKWLVKLLRWLFWKLPYQLGIFIQCIGNNFDKVAAWLIGFAVAVLIISLISGTLSPTQLLEQLLEFLK